MRQRPQSARSVRSTASSLYSQASEYDYTLRRELVDAIAERRQSEADLQLLENRIRHLEQEDAKAQKRIADTYNRIDEVRGLKVRNFVRKKRDETNKRNRQRRDTLMKQRRRDMYGTASSRAAKVVADRRRRTHSEVQRFKRQMQQVNRLGMKMHREEEKKKLAMHAKVRDHELALRQAKQDEADARAMKLANDCERQRDQELRAARAIERKIKRMEAMEKAMIKDLRATQVRQLEAYADLEERITEPLPASDYASEDYYDDASDDGASTGGGGGGDGSGSGSDGHTTPAGPEKAWVEPGTSPQPPRRRSARRSPRPRSRRRAPVRQRRPPRAQTATGVRRGTAGRRSPRPRSARRARGGYGNTADGRVEYGSGAVPHVNDIPDEDFDDTQLFHEAVVDAY